MVKNSLARRATEGTPLAPAFEGVEGTLAVVWGGEDIVSLAKEVVAARRGQGVSSRSRPRRRDGRRSSCRRTKSKQVSKWPSREEQLSMLVGQILGPGAKLVGQLLGPGGTLASQIKKKGEGGREAQASRRSRDAAPKRRLQTDDFEPVHV